MKKLMKSLAFVAVAAMSLTACQNDIDEQVNTNNEGVTLEVIADMGTRSVFGDRNEDKTYPSTWSGDEQVIFIANDKAGEAVTTPDNAGASTRFEPTFTASTDVENGTIYAMSPKGDYKNNVGGWGSFGSTYIYLTVPATQTPLTNSVDEAAHILYAQQSYEGAFPTSISMSFKHAIAYGRMTLKLPAGVEAETVELTFPVNVAGNSVKYYYNETDYAALYQNANLATITLNATNVENGVYWFGIVPTGTLMANTEITVNATNGNVYSKTLETAEEVTFNKATVTSFTVNMTKVEPVVPADEVYTKVTNVSDLVAGDKIIIAAAESDVAMSTNQKSNNRGEAAVSKQDSGNLILNPSDEVQIFTLQSGTKADTWAFYTGSGYIYAASSGSNYLRTENALSDNSSWTVTITDGVATIKAQGGNTRNWLRYNSSSSLFSCYTSGQGDIALYKYNAEAGEAVKLPTEMSFSTSEINIKVGESFSTPTLTLNGTEVQSYPGLTYSSSNTELATVNESTGVVTLVNGATGTTTITATFAGNDQYYDDNASYTITVTPLKFKGSGDGTEASPYDVTRALDIINSGLYTSDKVYIKGTISSITQVSTSYGNADYYITDGTSELLVYRGKYLDDTKFTSADQIKVGDEVVIYGALTLYGGSTPEVAQYNYLVKLVSSGSGEGDDDDTSDDTATGTTINCSGGDGTNRDSIVISEGNYTLTVLPGTHSSKPRWDSGLIRFYGAATMSNILTISGTTNITKVVFTCTSATYATALATGSVSVDSGATATISAAGTEVTITVTGSTKNVTLTGTTAQSRFSAVTVY